MAINLRNGWFEALKYLNKKLDQGAGEKSAADGITTTELFGATSKIVINFEDYILPTVDAGADGAHGSVKIYDLPGSVVSILSASATLEMEAGDSSIDADAALVFSVGTVTVGTDNATLTSTEANIIPSTALTLDAGVDEASAVGTAVVVSTTGEVFLNVAVAADDSSDDSTLIVNGQITIVYTAA